MIERFRELLRPSAPKELHAFLKSHDERGAWDFWCTLLRNRAEELEFEHCVKTVTEETLLRCALPGTLREMILRIGHWDASDWFAQWETLFQSVGKDAEDDTLSRTLRAETAYVLGVFFPMLRPAKSALDRARTVFAELFEDMLDGSGLPRWNDFSDLRELLASWERIHHLRERGGVMPWKSKSQQQYEWAVLQGLRFSRSDLTQVFSAPDEENPVRDDIAGESRKRHDSKPTKHVAFFESLLAHDSDTADRDVFEILASGRKTTMIRKTPGIEDRSLPETTYISDWSRIGQLRSGWSFEEPALSFLYGPLQTEDRPEKHRFRHDCAKTAPWGGWSDSRVLVELNFRFQTIFTGPWNVAVRYGGQSLFAQGPWTALCEICEPDHDYFEIECHLSGGFRLQRHFLLAHDEDILMLADTILPQKHRLEDIRSDFQRRIARLDDSRSDGSRKTAAAKSPKHRSRNFSGGAPQENGTLLEYESCVPLSASIQGHSGEPGATERVLYSRFRSTQSPILRILPLALPEWSENVSDMPDAPTIMPNGTLEIEDSSLSLRQYVQGTGLFAPMIFDLNPSRLRYPYTWRRLTVGENLEQVAHDQAVGFRVQLHKDQFLLYRSLSEAANRSVLGHNLVSDLFFARFDKTEGVQTVLEVQED